LVRKAAEQGYAAAQSNLDVYCFNAKASQRMRLRRRCGGAKPPSNHIQQNDADRKLLAEIRAKAERATLNPSTNWAGLRWVVSAWQRMRRRQ